MKNVIFVLCGFYIPAKNYGGPTTSIKNIVQECSDEYEFRIVVANHDLGEKEIYSNISEGWNEVGNAKVKYISDNEYTVRKLKQLFLQYDAKLIYLAGIFNININWRVLIVCKILGIPVLVAPRGELCKNTFSMKKYKKAPFLAFVNFFKFYKNAYFQATSEEEYEGIKKLMHIDENKIFFVPNLPSISTIPNKTTKKKGSLRVVFISRIQEKKNLLIAIKAMCLLKVDAIFDIYGPIESEKYWNECKAEIKKCGKNVKITYHGAVEPNLVNEVFSCYDCFLFPTISENYGHVIIEALMCGCIVVLSKGTTPWDDINGHAGFVCDNIQQYVEALECIASMDQDEINFQRVRIKEYLKKKINISVIAELHKGMFKNSITWVGNSNLTERSIKNEDNANDCI